MFKNLYRSRDIDRRFYPRGRKIFSEGDPGERAYIVQTGKVCISKTNDKSENVILAELGPDALFGEMALIDNQPRMATAVAVEPTTLFILNRYVFQDKLKNSDPFIRALLKIFVENYRDISKRTHR